MQPTSCVGCVSEWICRCVCVMWYVSLYMCLRVLANYVMASVCWEILCKQARISKNGDVGDVIHGMITQIRLDSKIGNLYVYFDELCFNVYLLSYIGQSQELSGRGVREVPMKPVFVSDNSLDGGTVAELVKRYCVCVDDGVCEFLNNWGKFVLCVGECKHQINGVNTLLKPCMYVREALSDGYLDGNADYLLDGVVNGFRIVNDMKIPSYHCKNYNSILKKEAKLKMDEIVITELGEGIVSKAEIKPHCVHSLGAVAKDNGRNIRCITDASRPKEKCINSYMEDIMDEFQFVTVKDIAKELTDSCWMSVLDIKGAYKSIPVFGDHRGLQGFEWNLDGDSEYYISNSMVFGLRSAPYIFTQHTEFIVRCMGRKGYGRVFGYLDDFLIMEDSKEKCWEGVFCLMTILRSLGFYINYEKLISPGQAVTYLGITLNSLDMKLYLPGNKLIRLKQVVEEFLLLKKCKKRELQQLVGLLAHCSTVIRGGRTFSRRAINLINSVVKQSDIIQLTGQFQEDLLWWKNFANMFNGKAAIISLDYNNCVTIYADASMLGFGASWGRDWLYGSWDDDHVEELVSEFNCMHHFVKGPSEILYSSAERELWPILICSVRWGKDWKGKAIHVFTDNTAVQIMLSTGRSKNKLCMQWLRELFWCSFVYNFEIFPHRITSKENVFCDALSRVKGKKFRNILRDYSVNRNFCCLSF